MGHRQDLLAAAKRLITEQGYAQITARDLVAASGTNLASIGYHFGSKDALLTAAVLEAYEEWDEIAEAVTALPPGTPSERLHVLLDGLRAAVAAQPRLFAAGLHVIARSEGDADDRRRLVEAYGRARRGFAALVLDQDPDGLDEHTVHAVGSLGLAVIIGVALQWLLDPHAAPDGEGLTEAARALAEHPSRPPPTQAEADSSGGSHDRRSAHHEVD
ncbi:TetR/AcrR family transcriptional regulator [Pseudonocardia sp. NPDC049635]|uniref:TetR/AcrR family transcriptional regulator n=1 Tax=Pseudonocardia sp. NPDC049635 TaxID=3155506 RepID=UPI00340F2C68